ncbi:MAG: ribulose-phosphate 3-epimerase [Brevinema sp.]
MDQTNIIPSIFAGNFSDIKSALDLIKQSSITKIHYDIMDNHFVPNMSFGVQFVSQVMQAKPEISADIHLMIDLPGHYEYFLDLNPEVLTIHLEAGSTQLVQDILKNIRSKGVLAGLAIKPSTPVSMIKDFLGAFDLLLIMSVEPGFSFQSFIPESIERVREARCLCGKDIIIEADGGINRKNMTILKEAGLDWFVMGGGFFHDSSPFTLTEDLKNHQ